MKNNQANRGKRLAALLAALVMVLCFSGCAESGDSFRGMWDLDGTTKYQFDGFGKGAMVLPSSSYEFRYTVDEEAKTILIDFAQEDAKDYTYTYELSESKLTLSGGIGNETFVYEFTKEGK